MEIIGDQIVINGNDLDRAERLDEALLHIRSAGRLLKETDAEEYKEQIKELLRMSIRISLDIDEIFGEEEEEEEEEDE